MSLKRRSLRVASGVVRRLGALELRRIVRENRAPANSSKANGSESGGDLAGHAGTATSTAPSYAAAAKVDERFARGGTSQRSDATTWRRRAKGLTMGRR